jgi:MFS family permease
MSQTNSGQPDYGQPRQGLQGHESQTPGPSGLRVMLRSLRHRNYRLFFGGQGLSLIGTWMQQAALMWLVNRLAGGHTEFYLGLVAFSGQIPTFLLTPFAGVVADRFPKRGILMFTQAASMLQSFILAALVITGHITVWEIVALSFFLGMVNSVDVPVRQAFVSEMVGQKQDLPNAIALNSSIFNGARIIGPALTVLVIYLAEAMKIPHPEGVVFTFNALSYLAVLAALRAMEFAHRPPLARRQRVLRNLKEGFDYCRRFAPIRHILILLGMVSLTGGPYAVLMPRIVSQVLCPGQRGINIFHAGSWLLSIDPSTTYYLLVSATGVGALIGAVYLANRKSVIGLGGLIPKASAMFGIGIIAFSLSQWFWLSAAILVVVGMSMMVQMASCNTILQTISDDDKRGRVMSFYAMSFMGTAPFGALIAGTVADALKESLGPIGTSLTLILGGAGCILAAVVFRLRLPEIRRQAKPVYLRLGIVSPPPPMPAEMMQPPASLDGDANGNSPATVAPPVD